MPSPTWIQACAVYNVALAVFHLAFWRLFAWRRELANLGAVNRGVMQVLNLMLIYFFLLAAALQFGWPEELTANPLGRVWQGGLAGFWLVRAALQPFFWPRIRYAWWMFTLWFLLGAGLHGMALRVS